MPKAKKTTDPAAEVKETTAKKTVKAVAEKPADAVKEEKKPAAKKTAKPKKEKPVAPAAAETKVEAPVEAKPAEEKAVEVKPVEKPKAVKKAAPKAEKKTAAKAEKKTAPKAEKKTAAKAEKKTAPKADKKSNTVELQFASGNYSPEAIVDKCKADYKEKTGKKTVRSIEVYVNAAEAKAYYVVNDTSADNFFVEL